MPAELGSSSQTPPFTSARRLPWLQSLRALHPPRLPYPARASFRRRGLVAATRLQPSFCCRKRAKRRPRPRVTRSPVQAVKRRRIGRGAGARSGNAAQQHHAARPRLGIGRGPGQRTASGTTPSCAPSRTRASTGLREAEQADATEDRVNATRRGVARPADGTRRAGPGTGAAASRCPTRWRTSMLN